MTVGARINSRIDRPSARARLDSLARKLAELLQQPIDIGGSRPFVISRATPTASGWNDPVAGVGFAPTEHTTPITAHAQPNVSIATAQSISRSERPVLRSIFSRRFHSSAACPNEWSDP